MQQTLRVVLVAAALALLLPASGDGADETAVFDLALQAPNCAIVGRSCDSGPSLLLGRDGGGPEPNQPNTINDSCGDGTSGAFHVDESNDRIKVSTLDGGDFAAGKSVRVDATVWAWSGGPGEDRLDLYYAANANSPSWIFIGTLIPPAGGAQTLSATYTLPSGGLQAVRARFRYQGIAAACGADSWTDHDDLVFAVGATPTPDFGISCSPSSLGVLQGGSANTTCTVASTNGFNGAVGLSCNNLPAGVTCGYNPNPVTPPANASVLSTLTISASGSAATGTFSIQAQGASGALTRTTNISVTVSAPPDFSLSCSPSSLSVLQGGSGASTCTVVSTNAFSSAVGLSCNNLPAGVTCAYNPAAVTPPPNGSVGSTLTVSVAGGTTTGSYSFPARGTSGSLVRTVNMSVTVTGAGGGAGQDLFMKDTPADTGVEPNADNGPMWVTEDIWVRLAPDPAYLPGPFPEASPPWTPLPHQDPEYRDPKFSVSNWVYVRVRNRGNAPSTGNERLRLYWAKASTGLSWPTQWVDYRASTCGPQKLYGAEATKPRKNAATATQAERDAYRQAIISVGTLPAHIFFGGVSYWHKQQEVHLLGPTNRHQSPAFLPWHREFVNRYEVLLQEFDPTVMLLYWDWTTDPANSTGGFNFFTSTFMGASGRGSVNPVSIAAPFLPPLSPPAVTRRLEANPPPAISDASVLGPADPAEGPSRYQAFSDTLEGAAHNVSHGFIGGFNPATGEGGDMSYLHRSTQDPFFFLLHGNVDRLWAQWQRSPSSLLRLDPATAYGSLSGNANITMALAPWDGTGTAVQPWTAAGGYIVSKGPRDASVISPPIYDTAPLVIPPLQPGQAAVIQIPWYPPNPADFACFGDSQQFCLLARIETAASAPFGLTSAETADVYGNTKANNNIVSRNIAVADIFAGPSFDLELSGNDVGKGVAPSVAGNDVGKGVAPSLAFVAPPNGSLWQVEEEVPIQVEALDPDGKILAVQLFVDGTLFASAEERPYSFLWPARGLGRHRLRAVAVDNDEGQGSVAVDNDKGQGSARRGSAHVTISVVANVPPAVKLTQPSDGAAFDRGDTILAAADADDRGGRIARVEFWIREATLFVSKGRLAGTATEPPFAVPLRGIEPGHYMLTAIAVDDGGERSPSVPVHLMVGGEPEPQ